MSDSATVQFRIRAAKPDDYDAVQATAEEVLPDLASDESRDAFSSNILNWRRAKRSIKVAEVDGQVVGHVSVGPYQAGGPVYHSACMTLHQLAVRREFQGKGIGNALLAEALKTAKGFQTGIVFAAVNNSSASFYEQHGWTLGETGEGFAFIEQEKVEDAGERAKGDIVGLLDKASTPRGGKVDLPGGFNRTAFLVTNQNEIRTAFHFPVTAENPEGLPLLGVIDKICADTSEVSRLPLSVLLMVASELAKRLGKDRARDLANTWVQESSEGTDMARRLRSPRSTPKEIFDHLFETV
ncbi:GNAT family N-acetyltransferase [Arthrobacter sp. KBS0703]|uniref:GNAT family N-acetyltransferase n=1 Tax=Arthrobacter sp. KBS0703 TaxID=1955698 RepID=UPI00098EC068|nr:GNAT family N-acetyltransferase [Arthrobacter sp. KBS0703]TSE15012.1 GNAT family N-acetyltransferase [Arthrobacter sp. KBS0703]